MNKIEPVEEASIRMLDGVNHCIGVSRLAKEETSGCIVDPCIVFATALTANAAATVLAH